MTGRELIDQITQVTSGSAVFVGGVARYYHNNTGSYKDVDFWIPSSSLQDVKDNFHVVSSTNGWTGILDECWMLRKQIDNGKRYHDIFVSTNEPSSSLISGSKFCTPEYDLHIHKHAAFLIGGTYLNDKAERLESLYND